MADQPHDPQEEGGDPACWAHLVDDALTFVDNATLAQLVRDLADGVVICDSDGTIVFWNAAATRIFGWAENEALGQTLDMIIPERLRERHWIGYRRVMATGETEYGDRLLEVPALHRDGHTISIAFTVSLLPAPSAHTLADPPLRGIAAVIRDDTERRQALKTALASAKSAEPAV